MNLSSFLHTVKWFQVFLYNSHNLTAVFCLHTVCSIWPIDRTLSGATTPGQSGPGSDDNEGVLYISQISEAGVFPSDSLMSHPGHSLRWGGLTPLQRCSWCILQPSPKPTGLYSLLEVYNFVLIFFHFFTNITPQEVCRMNHMKESK